MPSTRPALLPDRPYNLRLFGGFQLTSASGDTIVIPRRKGNALLAYLGVTIGSSIARDKLASLLWGQSEQRLARQSLRQILRTIGQDLSGDSAGILRLDGQMVSLDSDHIRVDAPEFEALIVQGDAESLAAAASLYRGEFLAGLSTDAPDFEDWLDLARSRYRDLALQGTTRLFEQQYIAGDVDLAAKTAGQALRIDPFREDIHRRLMHMYAERGMRAAALAQYKECESILRRELGVSPDDETLRLRTEILSRNEGPRAVEAGGPMPPSSTNTVRQSESPLLVGFDHELTLLRQHLDSATREGARLVLISGEDGAGKSALLKRFQWDQDQEGVASVVTRAHSAEQSMIFAIWKDLLNTRSLEIAGHQELSPSLVRQLAFLRGGQGISARIRRDSSDPWQAFDAMVELIRTRSKESVLILAIEDVHYADEASVQLLSYLLRNLRHSAVLFIATVSPEKAAGRTVLIETLNDLDRDGLLHRFALSALEREEVETLVRLLRIRSTCATVPRARMREIWMLSDGNPGLVVEAALAAGDESTVPESLHLKLASRLDGLDDTAKRLSATASVIGEKIELALLAQAANVDEEMALRGVETLIAAGVLSSNEEVLRFAHGRYHLAQYRSLLPARRRQIHLAVAQIIDERPIDNPVTHFATLAYHYGAAGRTVDALRNDLRLAQVQIRHGAHAQSRQSFRRVLKGLHGGADNSVEIQIEIEARLGLAEIEEITGNCKAALAELGTPAILKGEIPTAALRTQYFATLGRLSGHLGNDEIARNYLRRAPGKEHGNDDSLWQPSDRVLELIHILGGNAHVGSDHMVKAQMMARRRGLIADEVTVSTVLCLLFAMSGGTDTALVEAQTAVDGANRLNNSRLLAVSLHVRGVAQTWCGDALGALDTFSDAIELATSSGDLPRLYLVYGYRGQAFGIAGRYTEAICDLDTALRMADEMDFRVSRPLFQAWRARVLAEARDPDPAPALSAARAAIKMATAANRPWAYSVGLRALACALAHPDIRDFVGAERAIRSAMAEQVAMGFEFEHARSLSTLARILHSAGKTLGSNGLAP